MHTYYLVTVNYINLKLLKRFEYTNGVVKGELRVNYTFCLYRDTTTPPKKRIQSRYMKHHLTRIIIYIPDNCNNHNALSTRLTIHCGY